MLVYNALITVFLGAFWIGSELVGVLLPPVTAVHAVLTVLLAKLRFRRRAPLPASKLQSSH
jgi:hypothetical protein